MVKMHVSPKKRVDLDYFITNISANAENVEVWAQHDAITAQKVKLLLAGLDKTSLCRVRTDQINDGRLYLCCLNENNSNMYRCLVLERSSIYAKVFLVDFGVERWVSISELFRSDKIYSLPWLATKYFLGDVKPKYAAEGWNRNEIQQTLSQFVHSKLKGHFLGTFKNLDVIRFTDAANNSVLAETIVNSGIGLFEDNCLPVAEIEPQYYDETFEVKIFEKQAQVEKSEKVREELKNAELKVKHEAEAKIVEKPIVRELESRKSELKISDEMKPKVDEKPIFKEVEFKKPELSNGDEKKPKEDEKFIVKEMEPKKQELRVCDEIKPKVDEKPIIKEVESKKSELRNGEKPFDEKPIVKEIEPQKSEIKTEIDKTAIVKEIEPKKPEPSEIVEEIKTKVDEKPAVMTKPQELDVDDVKKEFNGNSESKNNLQMGVEKEIANEESEVITKDKMELNGSGDKNTTIITIDLDSLIGTNRPVYVSYIDDQNFVYCQLTELLDEKFELFTDDLQEFYNSGRAAPVTQLRVGDFLVARFYEDHCWYRAKVLKINLEKNNVRVFYIDYGNYEDVDLNECRAIEQKFCAQMPVLVKCKVVDNSSIDELFNKDANCEFIEKLDDGSIKIKLSC